MSKKIPKSKPASPVSAEPKLVDGVSAPVTEKNKSDKKKSWTPSKTLAVILIVLAVAAIGVASAVMMKQNDSTGTNQTATKKKKDKNKAPLTQPRHLDGVVVATEDSNKVPACVMIENAAFDGVRPQAGLSAAQVVYEVIVEGGITRLMAVFGGEKAEAVGPVRSARDTYLEFASEYNCAYAHAGGSFTAMQAIRNFKLRDVDGLMEGKWFWRDSNKYSPHNLFTSTDNLYTAIKDGHSWNDEPVFAVWNFVDDSNITGGEAAVEVNVAFGGSYDVQWLYNAEQKVYERKNGGVLQTDENTGSTLSTHNVIVQHVPEGNYIEGKGRVNFAVTGEGVVDIFRNGEHVTGTWKKADRLDRTRFFDAEGKEIALARGSSWVEIVPTGISFDWK